MTRILDVIPVWRSVEDADHSASSGQYRPNKHLFVFLAVLVGVSASGIVDTAEMRRKTSDGELEQEEEKVVVGSSTENSSSPSSMDKLLVASLFRSGFYGAAFDRICQRWTSRDHVTGSTRSPAAEMTSEDRRNSPSADSSDPSTGGAGARLRRSSARRSGGKSKVNEVLDLSECNKVDVTKAETADLQLREAAFDNINDVDNMCNDNNEGCLPIPQIIHLADRQLCSELPIDVNPRNLRTIIHACPDVMCCKAGRRCHVKRSVTVNKTFMVTDVKAVTIAFQNHTECSCGKPQREKKTSVRPAMSRSRRVTSPTDLQGSRSTTLKDAM